VNRHVLSGELEGNYIINILQGSGVGSKLADLCNTASVRSRQYVLVRGSSEGWCRRSEPQLSGRKPSVKGCHVISCTALPFCYSREPSER